MTDDKALVERLRARVSHSEILLVHPPRPAPDRDCHYAADRIEALSAENERLREALTQIARLRTDLRGDFSLGSHQSDIARAALGEQQ